MTSKQLLTIMAVVGIVGTGSLIGLSHVQAADSLDDYPPMIQKIAETFNLDPEEIENMFDQDREERQEEHLEAMVEEGTLTQEQRDLLEAKHEEMRDARDKIRNSELTQEERHEAMQEIHEEMETWAQETGIDLPHLGPRGGMGMHEGYGEGYGGGRMYRGMGAGLNESAE
jgi:phosphoketolase